MVVEREIDVGGGRGCGAGEEVGEDLFVVGGEGGGEGEDRRREVGERKLVGDGKGGRRRWGRVDCSFAVEFLHFWLEREKQGRII